MLGTPIEVWCGRLRPAAVLRIDAWGAFSRYHHALDARPTGGGIQSKPSALDRVKLQFDPQCSAFALNWTDKTR